jgi:hypothetical protein
VSAPASPFDLGGAGQVSREDLAAMSPTERLEAHKAGRTKALVDGDRGELLGEVLGVDANTLATMTPEAILAAHRARAADRAA